MIFLAISYDSRLLLPLSQDTAGGDDVLAFVWLPARKRARGFTHHASITYQLSYMNVYIRVLVIVSRDCHECTCNAAVRGITRGKVEAEAARRTAKAKRNPTSAMKYAYSDTVIGIINKQRDVNNYILVNWKFDWKFKDTKFFEISKIFKVFVLCSPFLRTLWLVNESKI